jgi:hypothetical protein
MSASGNIKCLIDKLPLPQGTYSISVWMLINKLYIINEKKCFHFSVDKGDFFGHGFLPKDNKNVRFYLDHKVYG